MRIRFHARPIEPVRWFHARHGNTRQVQHVLAEDRGRDWLMDALCGKEISLRSYRMRLHKPMVTINPDPDLPMCPECVIRLNKIKKAAP